MNDRLDRFRKLKEQFPDNEMPRWSLATGLEEMGAFSEAIDEFQELVALKPDYCVAWLHMGSCMIEEERLEEALVALETCRQLAIDQGHMAPRQEADMLIEQAREDLED
ncbi:MAG: tetratricopeptide repeat protein [Myxococcota bacterium]|nr:tetratricopeptide repeat protein [Myxococcota bacterium]